MKSIRLLGAFLTIHAFSLVYGADPRLPSLDQVLSAVTQAGYEAQPEQIPATVVDQGFLAFVPYTSFRIGDDREVNVYGDPENPACIEIGVYRALLKSESEKRKILGIIGQLTPQMNVQQLRLSGGKNLRGGIVAEITPPSAPDSYGGWWISIYSLDLIHKARGTSANVTIISQTPEQALATQSWNAAELARARRVAKDSLFDYSAPYVSRSSAANGTPTSSAGRVYVRAYTRKDGTYVQAHTRSR